MIRRRPKAVKGVREKDPGVLNAVRSMSARSSVEWW